MKKYWSWSIDELAKAADSRNVHVTNTRKDNTGTPKRSDYYKALKQADEETVFRFMDLPAELRTRIYKEALMFKSSWTCTAQLLSTCKEIRDEATNVLYGDNLIEIKIYEDTIQAHGHPCSWLRMADARGRDLHMYSVAWPHFLRRAQYIRCTVKRSIVSAPTPRAYVLANGADAVFVNQILYTLCSSLQGRHNLRSFGLDLQPSFQLDTTHIATLGGRGDYQYNLQQICYPLVMLGQLPELKVDNGGNNNLRLTHSAFTNTQHAGSAWTVAMSLEARLVNDYYSQYAADHFDDVPQYQKFWGLLGGCRFFDDAWEVELRSATDELNTYLATLAPDVLDGVVEDVAENVAKNVAENVAETEDN